LLPLEGGPYQVQPAQVKVSQQPDDILPVCTHAGV